MATASLALFRRAVPTALVCGVGMAAVAQQRLVLEAITLHAESGVTWSQSGHVPTVSRQAIRVAALVAGIPQAVTIATQDQIEAQAPRSPDKTLAAAPSADPNNYRLDSRFDAFTLRRFGRGGGCRRAESWL